MKSKSNEKKVAEIKNILSQKQIEYDNNIQDLLEAISKKDNKLVEDLISKKNNISVDIDMLKSQIYNLNYRKNQYGHELKEWNLRAYLD